MTCNEIPKSLDVFLGLLGEIDMIKNQISSLDKDTHIILAHDEVSGMMGNAECFRILKLIETFWKLKDTYQKLIQKLWKIFRKLWKKSI